MHVELDSLQASREKKAIGYLSKRYVLLPAWNTGVVAEAIAILEMELDCSVQFPGAT